MGVGISESLGALAPYAATLSLDGHIIHCCDYSDCTGTLWPKLRPNDSISEPLSIIFLMIYCAYVIMSVSLLFLSPSLSNPSRDKMQGTLPIATTSPNPISYLPPCSNTSFTILHSPFSNLHTPLSTRRSLFPLHQFSSPICSFHESHSI